MSPRRKLLLAAGLLVEPVVLRARGLPIGGDLIVRCRRGHLFTTIWIPSVSLKAMRLGWLRVQWCPVGRHLSIVTPVREPDQRPAQRREARAHHDLRLP